MPYEVKSFDLSGVQGLSKRAVDLHLGLYKGYVDQLNKLLEQNLVAAAAASPLALDGYNRRFAFEFNGVKLHELFFEQLAGKPNQAASADGALSQLLKNGFEGFAGYRAAVEALAKTRGVGWVVTLRDRAAGRLYNAWVDLHHVHLPAHADIVFVLDMWEHAFLLDFTPAQKADYAKIVLDNVDWTIVEQRCK